MANTETKVSELVINTMSEAKYASLKAAGTLNANELYFVKDDTEGVKSLGSATGDITLGSNLHIENNILSATNTITSIDGKAGTILLGDGLVMDGYTLKATATGGGGNAPELLELKTPSKILSSTAEYKTKFYAWAQTSESELNKNINNIYINDDNYGIHHPYKAAKDDYTIILFSIIRDASGYIRNIHRDYVFTDTTFSTLKSETWYSQGGYFVYSDNETYSPPLPSWRQDPYNAKEMMFMIQFTDNSEYISIIREYDNYSSSWLSLTGKMLRFKDGYIYYISDDDKATNITIHRYSISSSTDEEETNYNIQYYYR